MIFSPEQQNERLKWCFDSTKNGAWGDEPDGDHDVVCLRAADFDGASGRLNDGSRTIRAIDPATFAKVRLQPGDLIIEKSGGGEKQLVGRAVLFNGIEPSVCSNFLARARPSAKADSAYLNYLLLAIYNARGTWPHIKQSTGIQNLDMASYLNTRVSIPSLETQSFIAQFLDGKTAQIDALIEKKRALLNHLAKKRQALITHAVTKGLDPNAAMKDTGIDWLGETPAHWRVKRISFVSEVIDCKHRTPEYLDDGIPLVSTSEIKPYSIDYFTKRQVSEKEFLLMSEGGRRPSIGDIIYSRNASVGSAALVRSGQMLCLGQDLCIIRASSVVPNFLEYFLNSDAGLEQLNRELVGATFKRVNVDVIKKYVVILPPENEQIDIARHLNEALDKEWLKEQKISQSLNVLIEYRAALITAAVTGNVVGLK